MRLDNRGVSPVVGTILLVAITVAIAGTVGYFAMTQSPGQPAPTVSVEFDNVQDGNDRFTITHLGGDNVSIANLSVKVGGTSWDIEESGSFAVGDVLTVSAPDSQTLTPENKIMLIHKPSDSAIASTEVS